MGAGAVREDTSAGSVALTFRDELDAAPRARRLAADALAAWGLEELVDDARLVASELVTNGLLHAGAPVELRVRRTANGVRLEVEDRSRVAPVRPVAGVDAMTGRGISLVEAVSRRWGVEQLPGGKTVWSELTLTDAGPDDDEVDVDALLAAWGEDESAEPLHVVELGDVPTDLLLAAKAHADNLIREFALAAGGEASGLSGSVPPELAQLIETVVHRFAEARQAIKRQAVLAAASGAPRTSLRVALPLSAVEAGDEYLEALDLADAYARDARLLTLETPPAHRVFRRWYVGALVDQVRAAAAGQPVAPAATFEQRLLDELGAVAAAERASARSARLQAVTAELARTTTAEQVAQVVVAEGVAVLGAAGGAMVLVGPDGHLRVPSSIGYSDELLDRLRAQAGDADLPAAASIRTARPVWLESPTEVASRFPGMADMEPRTRSLCAVPVSTSQLVRGALRFGFDTPRLFDQDERAFIEALAAQTGHALERADLYEAERAARAEAEDVASRLARLQEVTTALAGARRQEEVAQIIVGHASEAVGATLATFSVLSDDATLTVVAARGLSETSSARWRSYPLGAELPASEAVRDNALVVVRDSAELERRYPLLAGQATEDRSLVCVPVSLGSRRLGVVSLSFPESLPPDEAQLRFLRVLADACAQALDRAAALERARVATGKLAFLAQASSELSSSLDMRETLARVADLVVPHLADWCSVQVMDDGVLQTVAVAHSEPAKVELARRLREHYPPAADAETGVPQVIRTGTSELYAQVTDEQMAAAAQDEGHLALLRELQPTSALVVPLTGRGGTFGALTMVSSGARRYDASDLAFAEDLAARAAVAVENARTYQVQSGQLAAITRVAEAAQHAILAPMPPRVGPLRLAASYVSAAQDALVGGDMYEVVARGDAVRLLIGDVRGKGLEAVRMATVVLGHFRSAAVECEDLSDLARQVDERLRPYLGDEDFVTALVAEVAADGTCDVIACGHPAALLVQDGELRQVGQEDSLPLGLGADPRPVRVHLAPGSRLLLFTDGLLEARAPGGAFVEPAAVLSSLTSEPDLDAALAQVLDALSEAIGGRLGDDLALLVAEYDPS